MTHTEITPQDPEQPQDTAAAPAADNSADNGGETMPSMEEMLQAAERKAQEHYDAWMYACLSPGAGRRC